MSFSFSFFFVIANFFDKSTGHQRADASYDFTTLYYGLGMVFLAFAAISLPYILGVTALFLR